MHFSDARIYQILFLVTFLLLGIGMRDWTLHPGMVGVTIATCLLTQWGATVLADQWAGRWGNTGTSEQTAKNVPLIDLVAIAMRSPASHFPPPSLFLSPLITGLGLSLLLRTDYYSTAILASVAAILSKFLLRFQGKHIFNPANFGIVTALLLTPDAWISPGQWGEETWYVLLFLATGGIVLQKVGRWDTTITFLGIYAGLEAIRNLWLGWTWDVWGHRLMSGSLLLFALFMVTDPRTIPNARLGRLIWAGAIALLTFFLRNTWFVTTAVFWALFVLAPFTMLLDRFLPAARFSWQQQTTPEGAGTGEVVNLIPPAESQYNS